MCTYIYKYILFIFNFSLSLSLFLPSSVSLIHIHTPGKYLHEIVAKYDMTHIHSSPIPLPAGRKIYMNEEWNGDENLRNLYQQIAGSLNYAAQLRPELMFSVS